MKKYKVKFTKTAVKMQEKLDFPVQKMMKMKIDTLAQNFDSLLPNIKKLKGEDLFRLRIRNYRVIFSKKDEELIIIVVRIGHRKDIYDSL